MSEINLEFNKIQKEKVKLKLPLCFVQEQHYLKQVYLILDQAKFSSYAGLTLTFERENKEDDWSFAGIQKGVWKSELQNLVEQQENYKIHNPEYFKLAMKEVAKGMESIVDDLDKFYNNIKIKTDDKK